ncbi:HAD family hydrolase [Candidatus Omnitrophota bacterium]
MPKFKLIIFDLDGTLVNSYPAIISSTNYTLQKLGLNRRSSDAIKRAVGWGDRALLIPFFGKRNLEAALSIYRRHHKISLKAKTRFMSYAYRLLSYLDKKGYKLAVASNRPSKFSDILLRHLKIKKFFDYVLCKDQIRYGKPHPSILNKVMHKLNVDRKEVLYVGDMAIDVRTGRRARVKTFAVSTGSSTVAELKKEKPSFMGRDLSRLFKIL